ncbi:MAG: hypothetical protein ABR517_04655 [Thermoanaerobaculia bacterium]
MAYTRNRRVHRIRLAHPIIGRLGSHTVVLVDISLDGAKIEHNEPLKIEAEFPFSFEWSDMPIDVKSRVTRCMLERFAGEGSDGLAVYHSGLHFTDVGTSGGRLKTMVQTHIIRALEEQKANARGVIPHAVDHMPIFRGHTLTANRGEAADSVHLHAALPAARIARQVGYIRYQLDRNTWRKKRTTNPEQPDDGFTVSASEDLAEIERLCEAYRKADEQGREFIRLLANLSLSEGDDGNPAG